MGWTLTAQLCGELASWDFQMHFRILHPCIFLSQFKRFVLQEAFPRCSQMNAQMKKETNENSQEGLLLGLCSVSLWGTAFDISSSENKASLQEEAEKKRKTCYTWLISPFTLTDRRIWEIDILICKHESFSNSFRLVRSFLGEYVSPFFLYTSEMFGISCLQKKPSVKSVFKLGSLALHLDVHIYMWVYQELRKASTGRLFC